MGYTGECRPLQLPAATHPCWQLAPSAAAAARQQHLHLLMCNCMHRLCSADLHPWSCCLRHSGTWHSGASNKHHAATVRPPASSLPRTAADACPPLPPSPAGTCAASASVASAMRGDISGTEVVSDVSVTVESCVDGSAPVGRRRLNQVRVVGWVRGCPCPGSSSVSRDLESMVP